MKESTTDHFDLEMPFKDCANDYSLEKLALFKGVEPEFIRSWIADCALKWVKAGSIVLSPETVNLSMLIVLEGRASIHLESADSEAVAHVGSGECLGEVSLFDNQPPSAVVVAESDLHLLVISHEQLLRLIEWSHQISLNLLYILSQRLRYCNDAISQSSQFEEGLKDHAKRDALTGFFNRQWTDNYLSKLNSSVANGMTAPHLSLLIIDIDNLSWFNDNYGRPASEDVLQQVAQTIGQGFRSGDKIARYDEARFIVILPDTDQDAATSIAQRLSNRLSDTPAQNGSLTYPCPTVSIGVANYQPGDDFGDLIAAKNEVFRQAKLNNGAQVIPIAS
ncbi:diguanylate cyclase [Seongchinamella sediminis]|uniref:diguanylate cyclase n=1 Tax=Seongchinamella sediminis TaxID=2283635 RepID=A0A3L7DVX7_9GAMM|nr:diguanylate cyclase [Seongchinamella sediminis]RLQ21717.1 diguanylate cyclase [Seongchinamella sediminis]